MEPMVSVCCVTYNHADYIAETLEGFLAQKTPFPVEILIHDDASSDGTAEIIKDYAHRYPEMIFPLFEQENQYAKHASMDGAFNFPRARGKYLALCEGDDYWCDPLKLVRQVEAMEADERRTFCFTNAIIHDAAGKAADRPFLPYYPADAEFLTDKPRNLELSELARINFIPTASFMLRRSVLDVLPQSFFESDCRYGDLRLKLYFTAAGMAHYLPIKSCVYRQNVKNSAFQLWSREEADKVYRRADSVVRMVSEVNTYSGGRYESALRDVQDHYLWVMAHNAPDIRSLNQGELGRVWRALPLAERMKCLVKAGLSSSRR